MKVAKIAEEAAVLADSLVDQSEAEALLLYMPRLLLAARSMGVPDIGSLPRTQLRDVPRLLLARRLALVAAELANILEDVPAAAHFARLASAVEALLSLLDYGSVELKNDPTTQVIRSNITGQKLPYTKPIVDFLTECRIIKEYDILPSMKGKISATGSKEGAPFESGAIIAALRNSVLGADSPDHVTDALDLLGEAVESAPSQRERLRLEVLGRLSIEAARIEAMRQRLDQLLVDAREQEFTWAEIGHALAITPQSAHGRWKTLRGSHVPSNRG